MGKADRGRDRHGRVSGVGLSRSEEAGGTGRREHKSRYVAQGAEVGVGARLITEIAITKKIKPETSHAFFSHASFRNYTEPMRSLGNGVVLSNAHEQGLKLPGPHITPRIKHRLAATQRTN